VELLNFESINHHYEDYVTILHCEKNNQRNGKVKDFKKLVYNFDPLKQIKDVAFLVFSPINHCIK